MSEFLDRISKLSPQRLALLADELNRRLEAAEQRRRVPLAIVGIGCRFPGGVEDPEGFWTLLSEGVDAVTEVPRSRWNIDDFYDRNSDAPGKMSTRWGGFIGAVDQFDPRFFGIAPAEAAGMDPQQRLLLETTWESLEHAGIAPFSLAETATGVFVGICNADYGQLALGMSREAITPYSASGLSHAVAAGRISYVLGLQGPCLAVDTSCSASLVAVHLACQSLRLGECETALAGGINLVLNPDVTIALSQSKMMAPDGRCKAFSNDANGFVRGEGCGMVVLKRLPDALRDHNRILAVIRGSATNQDGRSSGLTAPNGPSQEAVVAAALADAGLRPADIDAIEAHGTGTSLGDPIEAGALNAVFAGRSEPLWLGSVKTNVGHLESAAGIAGLIKLALSVEQGKIPASLHLATPNHRIEWDRLPLTVPRKLETWPRRGKTRVGGVSSFGFSGTNAHVIVEEAPRTAPSPADDGRAFLFPLSARTPKALQSIAGRLHRHLADHPSLALADIARTLTAGRSHFEFRAAVIASSRGELLEHLRRIEDDRKAGGIETGRSAAHALKVSFLIPGEEIPAHAGRELYERSPIFRQAIERCAEILRDEFDPPLLSVLYPAQDSSSDAGNTISSASLNAAQFALGYALAELWRACGIEPAAVLSWGVGEYVAAHIAGVFSLEDALRLAIGATERPSSGPDAGSPRASEPHIPLVRSTDAAASESQEMILVLGANADWGHFSPAKGGPTFGKRLLSLSDAGADARQFLHAAASLYVLGCTLDLSAFDREPANTVSLPTYPFERERYWLDLADGAVAGERRERSDARALTTGAQDGSDEWVYDLEWDPKPLPHAATAPFNKRLIDMLPTRESNDELAHYDDLNALLDPVCTVFIADALRQLGADSLPDRVLSFDEICKQLNIATSRRRLFGRLLTILVEDGMIERIGQDFRLSGLANAREAYPAAATELRKLQSEHPTRHIEINLLARCGKDLAAVLVGRTDPVHLLFPNNSTEEAEHIYGSSPMARYYNELIADGVQAAVENASGGMVRILEIGAGTGATTQSVLPRIAGAQFEYTFTDLSQAFLVRARDKFADYPSLDCRILNIENDPASQGFNRSEFDIVIAANVLHATADLRRTLAHIQELLTPGGLVLFLEAMRSERVVDLTFGLTDGWWRFADADVRPDHPLVGADTWTSLLKQAGMASTRVIACTANAFQRLIVGQASAADQARSKPLKTPRPRYVVLADESGIGAALHTLLTDAGESCAVIQRSEPNRSALSQLNEFLSRSGAGPVEIVYLWGTDVSDPAGSLSMVSKGEELCVKEPAHIIQAMLRQPTSPAHLWLITRGAQATPSFSPSAGGAAQSMIWGVGRTFGLENLERYRKLIDLPTGQSPHQAAACIFAELRAEDTEDQIAYRDGHRLAARLERSSLEKSAPNASKRLRKDGAYLVTGGLGGIGLLVSKWAAAQGAGHLVLLGRTGTEANAGPFATERLQALHDIRGLGADVTLVEGDVASEVDMKQLFQRFGGELPPIRGIFHAATVWGGTGLANVTDRQIERMLRPKVLGAWVLHDLTKNRELDFFLTFSSAASLLGSRGMAHYAAANQFLDSFAHFRRASGLPMLSVNWGAWDAMRLIPPEEQARLREAGVLPMPSRNVLSLFGDLVTSKRAQVMIAGIDWDVAKEHMGVDRTWPLLENLGGAQRKSRNAAQPSAVSPVSLRRAIEMPPEQRRKFIEEFVREQAAHVLGYRAGELPAVETPLPDLGLDSLMAVDLKNRLQAGLGQDLSPTIVFDYPTVCDIVGMLETMLWAGHGGVEGDIASTHEDVLRI